MEELLKELEEKKAELFTDEEASESTAEAPESLPEKEEPEVEKPLEEAPQKEEQSIPFHKHPRWVRMQEELKELRSLKEEISKPKPAEEKPLEPTSEEFDRLFGEDQEAKAQWQKFLSDVTKKQVEEFISAKERAEQARKAEQEALQSKAVNYAEEKFVELSEQSGLDLTQKDSTERNQIIDIVLKYHLYDENGLPRIEEANELRQALYPKAENTIVEEKKKIISKTTSKPIGGDKPAEVLTPSRLREIERRGGISSFFN